MKKNYTLSGTWLLSLILVVILGSKPQSTRAQDKKEIKKTIIIKNGDTLINGKNLKNVSKSERRKLLKELNDLKPMESDAWGGFDEGNRDVQVIIRKKKDGSPEEVSVKRLRSPQVMTWNGDKLMGYAPGGPMPQHFKIEMDSMMVKIDTLLKNSHFNSVGPDSNFRHQLRILRRDGADDDFEFFVNPPMPPHGPMAPRPGTAFRTERPEAKNSQSFSFSDTDKDGISNRLHFRLSDANKEASKKISGLESPKTDLNVEDLTIFPSFSTGKLNLAFNLKTKGAVEVKLLNSDFESVFTDKQANFNGTYYKAIGLPKNGVYYLGISQNGNWLVKKVVKE